MRSIPCVDGLHLAVLASWLSPHGHRPRATPEKRRTQGHLRTMAGAGEDPAPGQSLKSSTLRLPWRGNWSQNGLSLGRVLEELESTHQCLQPQKSLQQFPAYLPGSLRLVNGFPSCIVKMPYKLRGFIAVSPGRPVCARTAQLYPSVLQFLASGVAFL